MLKKLLIIICLLLLAYPAVAGNGRIYGVVVGEDGQPVAGARVNLVRDVSMYSLMTFTTDEGEYAFNDVPPGIYLVRALDEGMFVGEMRVEFMQPGDREVNLGPGVR